MERTMTFQQHLATALSQRQAMPHPQAAQLVQAQQEAQAARFAEQAATHQALRLALATYRLAAATRIMGSAQ